MCGHMTCYLIVWQTGKQFKTLSILDEFTRECLGILAARSIHAQDVISFLDRILKRRPAPNFLRSDNGSEFTVQSVQTWLAQNNIGAAFIRTGSSGTPIRSSPSIIVLLQTLLTHTPTGLMHPVPLLWMSRSPHTRPSAMLPIPFLGCSLAIPKPFLPPFLFLA